MDKNIIKEILSRKEPMFNNVSFPSVAIIMRYVNINLEIDRLSMDYYYEIDAEELSKSNITEEILNQLKDEGWTYDEKTDKIILYLKNKN